MKALRIYPEPDARPIFPPNIVIQVKALACELPFEKGIPLSRFSSDEIATAAMSRGIVAQVSGSTVWRWLSEDAIARMKKPAFRRGAEYTKRFRQQQNNV